ncbi:hypothetical protein EG68_11646 [Paragonimus skrjabini miyazakii]|uniref:Uncharacterized protein n=1 Tax=Paragonimus skrjabini miyazakii TaxID=59628 RepID=A0A8S9YE77_9TREM|nr:hypothetical protein EG68_11646 [Paragonimus skrjabini miyazakii]
MLSSVIDGGHIETQSTPTPPSSEKFCVGDDSRRWEFQAREYVFLLTQAERARVFATLLDGEALDFTIDEGILQRDINEGTFRRLLRCQFHGRIQYSGEKLAAFIRELRRLCAEGFTDDTPEVREQRILQQALEGTRDPSTRRAFLTAAPTSIQDALDRAGIIEQVNGVLERDQQYRTREIAPLQCRPLARPQPLNRQERYGPQRMQRPPYQKPHCYYCSLYGKRAYWCGHNRAITLKASETQEWAQMQSKDPDLHPIYQRLLRGQSRSTKQEVAGTSCETRCLWTLVETSNARKCAVFPRWPSLSPTNPYPRSRPSCVGCVKNSVIPVKIRPKRRQDDGSGGHT